MNEAPQLLVCADDNLLRENTKTQRLHTILTHKYSRGTQLR